MMTFICKKHYKNKNLLGNKVNIPVNARTISDNHVLFYQETPICIDRSQIARDYFVWDGDGCGEERWKLEQEIFKHIPYSPEITEMLQTKFPHLLNGDADTIIFNDYFYTQSHISELRDIVKCL